VAEDKKRHEAFERFMKMREEISNRFPPNFDYKKELANYRDERYGYLT
jgi:hypothetical protein